MVAISVHLPRVTRRRFYTSAWTQIEKWRHLNRKPWLKQLRFRSQKLFTNFLTIMILHPMMKQGDTNASSNFLRQLFSPFFFVLFDFLDNPNPLLWIFIVNVLKAEQEWRHYLFDCLKVHRLIEIQKKLELYIHFIHENEFFKGNLHLSIRILYNL